MFSNLKKKLFLLATFASCSTYLLRDMKLKEDGNYMHMKAHEHMLIFEKILRSRFLFGHNCY